MHLPNYHPYKVLLGLAVASACAFGTSLPGCVGVGPFDGGEQNGAASGRLACAEENGTGPYEGPACTDESEQSAEQSASSFRPLTAEDFPGVFAGDCAWPDHSKGTFLAALNAALRSLSIGPVLATGTGAPCVDPDVAVVITTYVLVPGEWIRLDVYEGSRVNVTRSVSLPQGTPVHVCRPQPGIDPSEGI